ncbi:DLA class I histocompatibility antigen, A9/A9 alpha chain-like isoform X1 [Nelusetta ayraudi]|uniref:DLA class I histocompatibility antigen, A9/A9 alpha chain-like isoform X1 n=1 Tax=Nelusetta ayraudi TaxID=303726 RepID=UPI003F6ECD24
MKTLVFVSLLALTVLHRGDAVRHSMQYFYTASSGVPNFPEFVAVGMVDETQFVHYDSNTEKLEPKQDWMKRVLEVDPQYRERNHGNFLGAQQGFKVDIETAKGRFNQTGGVHLLQWMCGCEWDDETGEVDGFDQLGYDGEDFISLDLKTQSWVAARPQAVITKQKWDNNDEIARRKHYLSTVCPDWVKKYLELGRSSLLRTELPSVSFLQKTPSSPVSCHATGFYPGRAALTWTKDGVELHEGVERGEILPNQDGSFQMSAELKLESDQAGDWGRYQCVFQLAGEKKDMATTLHKDKLLTNWEASMDKTVTIAIAAACVLVLILGVIAVVIYRRKKAKHQPSPVPSREVLEELNPKA